VARVLVRIHCQANIQEGLPFPVSVSDVKHQTEFATLVAPLSEVAENINVTGLICHTLHEYNTMMQYLMNIDIFEHFHTSEAMHGPEYDL